MARVIVGMSGGVDSSVTVALLKQDGYDVIGVTLNVWPDLPNMPEMQREDACCALGAVEDARRVADKLDIPYYVLYVMSQDRLGAAMMPLGDFTKSTTRQMAADLDLAVANKPESQDICFVPFKRYTEFIELYAPEVLQPGPIVNGQGEVLGEHRGVALHTVGQRRGLGIA